MRKIKFRVWDGNLMHNVSELHFCMGPKLDGNGLKFYGPGVGQGWIDGENVHLMQYTDLKDKNGKEIYEGDIVSRHDGGIHFQEEPLAEHIVKWGEFGWLPFNIGIGKSRCVYGEIFDFIVIGNIYENPELLEESK
ncbi:YopX family protein [Bacillus thuringiensis]|uniref:YopX family protein n=1 Tax=Bacillus thuringiensis TaxID=1428 RepID=UPI000BFBCB2C|nr:YopX family protein [Bacillus thuringiensis]PGK77770.1 hypothetical protein CN928_10845 [Bacillus thuringiensis]